jgi:hypothetical protein
MRSLTALYRVLPIIVAAALLPSLHSQSTWNAGDGNWGDSANWLPNVVPDPWKGAIINCCIETVTVNSVGQAAWLNLNGSPYDPIGPTLVINGSGTLQLGAAQIASTANVKVDNGTLALMSYGSGNSLNNAGTVHLPGAGSMTVQGDWTATGAGTIALTGGTISGYQSGDSLTLGGGQTVSGYGTISGLTLHVGGDAGPATIISPSGGTLTLRPTSPTFGENAPPGITLGTGGLLEAAAASTLTIDLSGGRFSATSDPSVAPGTLRADVGGTLNVTGGTGSFLPYNSNTGTLRQGIALSSAGTLVLGTIAPGHGIETNQANITLETSQGKILNAAHQDVLSGYLTSNQGTLTLTNSTGITSTVSSFSNTGTINVGTSGYVGDGSLLTLSVDGAFDVNITSGTDSQGHYVGTLNQGTYVLDGANYGNEGLKYNSSSGANITAIGANASVTLGGGVFKNTAMHTGYDIAYSLNQIDGKLIISNSATVGLMGGAAGLLTNNGVLQVDAGAQLRMAGLANISSSGVLSGGTYTVAGRLEDNAADIRTIAQNTTVNLNGGFFGNGAPNSHDISDTLMTNNGTLAIGPIQSTGWTHVTLAEPGFVNNGAIIVNGSAELNLWNTTFQGGVLGSPTPGQASSYWVAGILDAYFGTVGPNTTLTLYGGGDVHGSNYIDSNLAANQGTLILDSVPLASSHDFQRQFNNSGNIIATGGSVAGFEWMTNNGTLTVDTGSEIKINRFLNISRAQEIGEIQVSDGYGTGAPTYYTLHYDTLQNGNYVLSGALVNDVYLSDLNRNAMIGAIGANTSVTLNPGGDIKGDWYVPGCMFMCSTPFSLSNTLSENNGSLTVARDYRFSGGLTGTFINNGTLTTLGQDNTVAFTNFTNNGTLVVGAGSKMSVLDNWTNLSGGTLTGGTYAISGALVYEDGLRTGSDHTINTAFYDQINAVGAGTTVRLDGPGADIENYRAWRYDIPGVPPSWTADHFGGALGLNDGTIQVVNGATLNMNGTTFTMNGTSYTGFINNGAMVVDNVYTTLTMWNNGSSSNPNIFTNNGDIQVLNDGTFNAWAKTVNNGSITASGVYNSGGYPWGSTFAAGDFTNNGTLTVANGGGASLNNLTNLSAAGVLTGGTYNVSGLQYNGSSFGGLYYGNTVQIQELGPGTHLSLGPGYSVIDGTHMQATMNALTALKTIDAGASLTLYGGAVLVTDPGFRNDGTLTVQDHGSALTVDDPSHNGFFNSGHVTVSAGGLLNTTTDMFNNLSGGVTEVTSGGVLMAHGLHNLGELDVSSHGVADFIGGTFANLDANGVLSGGTYNIFDHGEMFYQGVPITSLAAGASISMHDGGEIWADDGGILKPGFHWLSASYGELNFYGALALNGPLTNSGILTVHEGGQLDLGGAILTNGTGGDLLVDGGLFAPVDLKGGMLEGDGTVTGDVIQEGGTVKPGHSPGTLTIHGDYIVQHGGVLEIDFEDPADGRGTGWGFLDVSGNATLNGTLNLVFLDPGAMLPGTYEIMDYARWSGSGLTLSASSHLRGFNFSLDFQTTQLFLDVNAQTTPEPASWALLLGGGILMGALRKARKRRKGRQSRSNPSAGPQTLAIHVL